MEEYTITEESIPKDFFRELIIGAKKEELLKNRTPELFLERLLKKSNNEDSNWMQVVGKGKVKSFLEERKENNEDMAEYFDILFEYVKKTYIDEIRERYKEDLDKDESLEYIFKTYINIMQQEQDRKINVIENEIAILQRELKLKTPQESVELIVEIERKKRSQEKLQNNQEGMFSIANLSFLEFWLYNKNVIQTKITIHALECEVRRYIEYGEIDFNELVGLNDIVSSVKKWVIKKTKQLVLLIIAYNLCLFVMDIPKYYEIHKKVVEEATKRGYAGVEVRFFNIFDREYRFLEYNVKIDNIESMPYETLVDLQEALNERVHNYVSDGDRYKVRSRRYYFYEEYVVKNGDTVYEKDYTPPEKTYAMDEPEVGMPERLVEKTSWGEADEEEYRHTHIRMDPVTTYTWIDIRNGKVYIKRVKVSNGKVTDVYVSKNGIDIEKTIYK